MLIFQLIDQYVGIAKAAMFGCSAKLNKSFRTNIIEILLLIMCIPRKINFLQLRQMIDDHGMSFHLWGYRECFNIDDPNTGDWDQSALDALGNDKK